VKTTDWKSTAELIGIAAIVASLIFVGLQMRQEQEIAQAQAIGDFIATGVEFRIAMTEHAGVLVKGNSGEQLDATETKILRSLVAAEEDRVFLQILIDQTLGSSLNTAELIFASFLYRNPAAREAWLQIADDMELYVDPLRTPESLARTRESGSSAFRERVKTNLVRLDELYQ
jgi:hypothetical protein